jgi:hypothetical protein
MVGRALSNWFAYVIGFAICAGGVMLFGELLGWVVDRVSPTTPNKTRSSDEDAVDHRFYRSDEGEDY